MNRRLSSILIAVAIFILDRVTKVWIERNVSVWDTHNIIPGLFNIVHTKNRGAAFGMFAESDGAWRMFLLIGVSLIVLVLVTVALLRPASAGLDANRRTLVGLSLVLGGAAGNLYDRIVFGMVTDFLEFFISDWRFAAFNVADAAITTGAGLLLLDMWMTRNNQAVRT